MSEYRLTPQAKRDLRRIGHYTRREWGLTQRDTYLRLLVTHFEHLAVMPGMGRSCEAVLPTLRASDCRQHVIYYRQTKEGIEIIRILHHRQDTKRVQFDA